MSTGMLLTQLCRSIHVDVVDRAPILHTCEAQPLRLLHNLVYAWSAQDTRPKLVLDRDFGDPPKS